MKFVNPFHDAGGPVIFYVTDGQALGSSDPGALLEKVHAAAAAGVDCIQIREKRLLAGELLNMTRRAMRTIEEIAAKTRLIVNDRLDVALAAGVAGVHLGRESVPAPEVIRWCRAGNAPAEFLVGVSCHSVDDAREAETAGASYVFFGPVFDTPSKRAFGPPLGLALLSEARRAVGIPVIAIGGMLESNSAKCVRAGAAGIAAIRLFQEAPDAADLQKVVASWHGIRLD